MRIFLAGLVFISFGVVNSQKFANFAKDSVAGQECFCLPPNQRCDPTLPIPRNALKIQGVVDTRILNSNPESLCSNNRVPCCFSVAGGGSGTGGIPDVHPPFPPLGQASCGLQFPLERRKFPGQADFGEYPWMALIVQGKSGFIGSGALVSNQHIITAAHRLPDRSQWNALQVRIGDYDIGDEFDRPNYPVQVVPVANIIIHPQFNSKSLANDIAIIKLQRRIEFGHHALPICLPERGQKFVGQRCFVSGWGKDTSGQFQPIMKEVDLPIVDSYECEERLRATELSEFFRLDKKSFMCAGGEPGKDSCEGDGGAPLVCKEPGQDRLVAVGLVAWGRLCGTTAPGAYVNLEFFSDFINRNLF